MLLAHLIAAALLEAAAAEPATPFRCVAEVEIDGLRGSMWRDFGGREDDFHILQLYDSADPGGGPRVTWSIDNRPRKRPRDYGWLLGRPKAVVFDQGPDHVAFGAIPYEGVRDGALHARLYGDGVYAGTIFVQRARDTRRAFRQPSRAASVSVSQQHYPAIVAALAHAAEWRAELVDSTGRLLGESRVRLPSPGRVESEFARAKARILADRETYLANSDAIREGSPCAPIGEPEI